MEVVSSRLPPPERRRSTLGSRSISFPIAPTGLSPSKAGPSRPLRLLGRGCDRASQPHIHARFPARVRFGLFPFRSPLLRESLLVSFPPPTWMLPFGGFPLPEGSAAVSRGGKSHSGISGSKAACAYPELIAACHALPRRPSQAIHQVAYHAGPTREPTLEWRPEGVCAAVIASPKGRSALGPRARLGSRIQRTRGGPRSPLPPGLEPYSSKEVIRPQVPLRPPCYDFSLLA